MQAMMMMPPTTTTREAHRSRTMRRAVRARLTDNGRALDSEGPPADSVRASIATYWTLFSSSLATVAGIGKYPSLTTPSWPSFETISLTNSRVSGSRALPGALLT